jgi:hypothetical protein
MNTSDLCHLTKSQNEIWYTAIQVFILSSASFILKNIYIDIFFQENSEKNTSHYLNQSFFL